MLHPVSTLPISPDDGFSPEESAAMQRAVLRLFQRWALKDDQAATLLGDLSTKTISRWRKGELGRVSRDLADRMSNLLGVHKALRIVYSDPQRGYDWIRRENSAFGGASALDVMLGGGLMDIVRVRRYLDSVRGGW
jgi:hypothetical protein